MPDLPRLALLALCMSAGCATATPGVRASPSADAQAAWTRLANMLPGSWEAPLSAQTVQVSYRLSARDSVLVETWMPDSPAETVTLYHLDGGRLMLTHYCGQGNQPRLELTETNGADLLFKRFDATDLDADQAALFSLGVSVGENVLVREEVYARGDEREATRLSFDRLPGPQADEHRPVTPR